MPITTDLTTSIGDVRYLIGDDVDGAGVLPSGGNYTDSQVQRELTASGGNTAAAAARLCRNLARRWAVAPQSFTADGLTVSRSDMAAKWTKLAENLEAEVSGASFGTVPLDRRDGYSADLGTSGDEFTRDDGTEY